MESGQLQPPLIVVAHSSSGTRVHIYPDVPALLAAGPFTLGGVKSQLEFFDSQGYRLAPVFDKQWQLGDLQVTADSPDPTQVLKQLRAAVSDVKHFAHRLTAQLPAMDTDDLAEAVTRVQPLFGHSGIQYQDPGSAFHNLFVHGIW
jgi:hypothetical protein